MPYRRSKGKLIDYEPKRRNPITLGDDSNLATDYKPIKIDGKNTILELSESSLDIKGNLTVDGTPVVTDLTETVALNDLSDVTYDSGDLTISSLDKIVASGDLKLEVGGDIELNADGAEIIFKDGIVQFAKFAKGLTGSSLFYSIANVNDYFKIDVGTDGVTTLSTTDADTTVGHLTLDADGDIILDSHTGVFIAKKAGTEFSAANSSYAGMILGYTDIGLDETHASYTLTTSFVVPTDEWGVTFTAPPSGNVEIMTSFQFFAGSTGGGDLAIGLSTANATSGYSALADFHEEIIVDQSGRYNFQQIHKTWTLTGLTAGTSYTYYVGVLSSSTSGNPSIRYGGNNAGRYPDFIMKATALPATITT